MLRRVAASARAAAHADAAAILLYDHAAGRFVPVVPSVAVGSDERWLQREGPAAGQALAQRAVAAADVVVVRDTALMPKLDFPLLAGGLPPERPPRRRSPSGKHWRLASWPRRRSSAA